MKSYNEKRRRAVSFLLNEEPYFFSSQRKIRYTEEEVNFMGIISKKEIEVRYAETDQMGVVYHANYIVWLEIGRTALVKDLGFTYAGMEKDGLISPVLDVNIQYKKPCVYGETVTVETWIQEHGRVRTTYGYRVLKENGDVAATATTTNTLIRRSDFRPVSLSRVAPDWEEAYRANVVGVREW